MPEVVCAGVCFRVEYGGAQEERSFKCGVGGWEDMRTCRSGGGVVIGGCGGLGIRCWCGWWRWWGLNSGKLAREWWWVRLLCRGGWEMGWCIGGGGDEVMWGGVVECVVNDRKN